MCWKLPNRSAKERFFWNGNPSLQVVLGSGHRWATCGTPSGDCIRGRTAYLSAQTRSEDAARTHAKPVGSQACWCKQKRNGHCLQQTLGRCGEPEVREKEHRHSQRPAAICQELRQRHGNLADPFRAFEWRSCKPTGRLPARGQELGSLHSQMCGEERVYQWLGPSQRGLCRPENKVMFCPSYLIRAS